MTIAVELVRHNERLEKAFNAVKRYLILFCDFQCSPCGRWVELNSNVDDEGRMGSITFKEEDEQLFKQVMALDGFDPTSRGLTTWMKSVCRRYCNERLGLVEHPLQGEINKLSDQLSESHNQLMSEIQKLTQPFEE